MNTRQRLARIEARNPSEETSRSPGGARLWASLGVLAAYHAGGWRPGDNIEAAVERVLAKRDRLHEDLLDFIPLPDDPSRPWHPNRDVDPADAQPLIDLWESLPIERTAAHAELEAAMLAGRHLQGPLERQSVRRFKPNHLATRVAVERRRKAQR